MAKFKLSRRTVLRGAGSVAIGLPWLEAMGHDSAVAGRKAEAKRFIGIYTPGGAVKDSNIGNKWSPTGTEDAPVLSPVLAPLEKVKSKLLTFDGLGMPSALGEQHQAGIISCFTGTAQNRSANNYAGGPSIDQVLAGLISKDKRFPSLELAIRWATGKSKGKLHPINSLIFADEADAKPIAPRLDPVAIYDELFGTAEPGDGRLDRQKSVIDYVGKRYEALTTRLGAHDKAKLDEHLTKVRELEGRLDVVNMAGAVCKPPELIDTSGYDPNAGVGADPVENSPKDQSTDESIPAVGRLMMDMIVMALACEKTSVATLQWSDTEAKHTFPWLNLKEHHHFYQHDGGFAPNECEAVGTWYSEQHAYMLEAMDAIDMGGHTLLDESIVFYGSEIGHPPTHKKEDVPFMIAGGGGGIKTGRHLKFPKNSSHTDLLVSILNLFGDERTTFGDPEFVKGPLAGIV